MADFTPTSIEQMRHRGAKFVTVRELLDLGLLMEINRQILHPVGLALAVETLSGQLDVTTMTVHVFDARTDPDGFVFDDSTAALSLERVIAYLRFASPKWDLRASRLGYTVQPIIARYCVVCGCTEDHACDTPDGPCHWEIAPEDGGVIGLSGGGLCSAHGRSE